jgi:hypothetical protein
LPSGKIKGKSGGKFCIRGLKFSADARLNDRETGNFRVKIIIFRHDLDEKKARRAPGWEQTAGRGG